jgi:hypothetical protein
MIPMGTVQRKCPVCGYPINATGEALTAHELACLETPGVPEKRLLNQSLTPVAIAAAIEN